MFDKATANIVKLMSIGAGDRLVIVTDESRQNIGSAIAACAKSNGVNILYIKLEDFTARPAKDFPITLKENITAFDPTCSIYCAQALPGEFPVFRGPLVNLLTKVLHCRHGHMVGIDERVMLEGMSANYDQIITRTNQIFELVQDAKLIEAKGDETEVRVELSSKRFWVPSTGVINSWEKWSNLPDGEVFTCPMRLDGRIAARVVGDEFTAKYGILENPLVVTIENSFITDMQCENKKLEEEFRNYVSKYENGNRVGEFAIGTLEELKAFTGNLLQDEKFPGIHLAFGHTYPDKTNADWDSQSHVDLIPTNCSIWVDGKMIMDRGKFVV